jgi:hypothetical protein
LEAARSSIVYGTEAYPTQNSILELLEPETYAQYCDLVTTYPSLKPTVEALDAVALKIKYGEPTPEQLRDWKKNDSCKEAGDILGHLESLDLSQMKITDLRPISTFRRLKSVKLSGNLITDLTPLISLQSLEELHLNDNSLRTLTPLARIPSLGKIYAQGNQLVEIESLSGLRSLTLLDVRRNSKRLTTEFTRNPVCKVHDLSEDTKFVNLAPDFVGLGGCVGSSCSSMMGGRVVFAGGKRTGGAGQDQIKEVRIRDDQGRWTLGGDLEMPRAGHTVTLLQGDLELLLVGGDHFSQSFEVYSLNAAHARGRELGRSIARGRLQSPRFGHTATLLGDGRVLITGGFDGGNVASQVRHDATARTEIFSPVTRETLESARLSESKGYHAAVLMGKDGDRAEDRKVLISGGISGGQVSKRIEIFDPAERGGQFKTIPGVRLIEARYHHTMTRLPDGRILIVGGFGRDHQALSSAEIYDPETQTITEVPSLETARGGHSAVLLGERWVLIAGGTSQFLGGLSSRYSLNGEATDTSEIYDLVKGHFVSAAKMQAPKGFFSACAASGEGNCKVFLAPGMGSEKAAKTYEEFDWTDLYSF